MPNPKKHKIYIIAEMAWSHDGSIDNAKKIIKGAADAKADAVSFHITDIPSYMVKDYGKKKEKVSFAWQTQESQEEKISIYDYLEKINLKERDWRELFAFARSFGLEICAMPNDFQSLELCKKLKPERYVIGPACFVEDDFIIEVAKRKKPVVLRIGGATIPEIENAVRLIRKYGIGKILLLHGIQLYPAKTEDMNLNGILLLKKKFNVEAGLADHMDGGSESALILPLLAVALGVSSIEKHLTYDRSKKGEDYESALDPASFKKFIEYIREAEKALGKSELGKLSEGEIKYRDLSRKKIVAAVKIKKGEKITKEKVTLKRATEGLFASEIKSLLGKKATSDIGIDEPVSIKKLVKEDKSSFPASSYQ